MIANTPKPPYVAVIFSSLRDLKSGPDDGYAQTAQEMLALAAEQPGYLGVESTVRDENGFAITVSYWQDEASALAFKQVGAHKAAQKAGRQKWYRAYQTRVAVVTRAYGVEG